VYHGLWDRGGLASDTRRFADRHADSRAEDERSLWTNIRIPVHPLLGQSTAGNFPSDRNDVDWMLISAECLTGPGPVLGTAESRADDECSLWTNSWPFAQVLLGQSTAENSTDRNGVDWMLIGAECLTCPRPVSGKAESKAKNERSLWRNSWILVHLLPGQSATGNFPRAEGFIPCHKCWGLRVGLPPALVAPYGVLSDVAGGTLRGPPA
jgi:hypothetical protein